MKNLKNNQSKKPYAKKSFGQNFLVDQNYINKIISSLDPQEGETIVEIGSGRGALTEQLIESGANIIAIELERDMIAVLQERFSGEENFQLIESDALKIDFNEISQGRKLKLVANLPYYISTAILQKLIEQREIFSEMILMFQLEVVERITAKVGSKDRGFLTVLVEANLEAEKLFDVSPNAFRPAPKVWSAIVRLIPKADNPIADTAVFYQLISAAFRQKRKTIINNLKNLRISNLPEINWLTALETARIEPERRAENLDLEEWRRLYFAILPNQEV